MYFSTRGRLCHDYLVCGLQINAIWMKILNCQVNTPQFIPTSTLSNMCATLVIKFGANDAKCWEKFCIDADDTNNYIWKVGTYMLLMSTHLHPPPTPQKLVHKKAWYISQREQTPNFCKNWKLNYLHPINCKLSQT